MEVENKALRKRNDKLEDKFKDLKSKLEIIEQQIFQSVVTAEKEEVEKSLEDGFPRPLHTEHSSDPGNLDI